MNCRRAQRLMPFFAGKDLDETATRAVAAHVSRCTRCGELDERLRRGRNWLRGAPPPVFRDLDYATLRRGVWRRIEAAGSAPLPGASGRLILAGGALLSLLLATILILRSFPADIEPPPTAEVGTPSSAGHLAAIHARNGEASERETRAGTAARAGTVARPRNAPARLPESSEPEDFVKIEFQTADPNVRIIWLVQRQEVS